MLVILNLAFSLYLSVIFLRFLLQWAQADYHNPISQIVRKMTKWPDIIMARIVPSSNRVHYGLLVFMGLLGIFMHWITILYLDSGDLVPWIQIVVMGIGRSMLAICDFIIYLIIIAVIISWVSPHQMNPFISIIRQISEALFSIVRRVVPPTAGIDWAPMVLLILVHLLEKVVLYGIWEIAQYAAQLNTVT